MTALQLTEPHRRTRPGGGGSGRRSRETSGPVVLAADPASDRVVFDAAFRAAADLGTNLVAVRVHHDPVVELGGWLSPDRVARWDAATERRRYELDAALTSWRAAFPEIEVTEMVVDDDPFLFLEALSHRAVLLVVGRLTGDLAEALAHHARCPVMVVGEVPDPERRCASSVAAAGRQPP